MKRILGLSVVLAAACNMASPMAPTATPSPRLAVEDTPFEDTPSTTQGTAVVQVQTFDAAGFLNDVLVRVDYSQGTVSDLTSGNISLVHLHLRGAQRDETITVTLSKTGYQTRVETYVLARNKVFLQLGLTPTT